ncbi:hypothetical protein LCGC14_0267430 [marine sediment metagenome]|uniref:Uncharacterized protein n=1 Tax=marine sediment metagenome TaxID=412755 RepID=A0A0F9UGS0_9ZZZZ
MKIFDHRERCAGCKGYIDRGEHVDCLERLPDGYFSQEAREITFHGPSFNLFVIDDMEPTLGSVEVQLTYKYYYK